MADARAGRPEVKAVAAGHVAQEAVGFNVVAVGNLEILANAGLSRHEVVGNQSCGQCDAFLAGGEELQEGRRCRAYRHDRDAVQCSPDRA